MHLIKNYKNRLRAVSRRPTKIKALVERDGQRCFYCGTEKDLTVDHVKPLSKGGSAELDNLRLACKSCNIRKSNKDEEFFKFQLIKEINLINKVKVGRKRVEVYRKPKDKTEATHDKD